MAEAFHGVEVTRVRDGVRTDDRDRAATEEPLEVRLHDQPFAVIMRTPGADRELAAGFLLAEGVLKSADDLGTIEYCTDPSAEHPENIVNARLVNGSAESLDAHARRAPQRDDELVVRDVRAADDRIAPDEPAAALVVPWTFRRPRSSRFPIGCGRRRPCSRRPAGCTRPGSSRATAGSRRSPKTSAATTRWTRSSAGC